NTEDIAAAVLLEIVANDYAELRAFKGQSGLATYLFVIARRICIRELACLAGGPQPQQPREASEEGLADAPSPVMAEGSEEVQRLLSRLPARERSVVVMYYLEGRTYEEISAVLNIPVNAIGAILSRARKKIRAGEETETRAPRQPRPLSHP